VVGAFCIQCGRPTTSESDSPSPSADATSSWSPVVRDAPPPVETVIDSSHLGTTHFRGPLPAGPERRSLVWETRWVMVAFLLPGVVSAIVLLSEHISGVGDISRFATYVRGQPLTNMLLGILAYLPVGAVVPLGLYLLARTGQDRHSLGLQRPTFRRDVLPGLGIGLAAFGCEMVLALIFYSLLVNHHSLFVSVSTQHVPKYYVIWGIAISAVTAVTEEVLVNGYLITRLGQLGWSPRAALAVSLILRTSYHVYYGIGFLFTVPFGYIVTRSFQKHGKLARPIMAHFLYDAILFTISILR
jgi:membrane protease YdiL (CAAX protease family)